MRYIILLAGLLSLLAGISCSSTQKLTESTASGKFKLVRVAVEEHRFTDASACEKAARLYHGNNHADGDNGQLRELTAPAGYSWRAKNIEVEVRFIVLSASEINEPGEVVKYWEINKRTNDYGRDIREAIKEFIESRNWEFGALAQDGNEVNGKKAWRAIVRKGAFSNLRKTASQDSLQTKAADRFGIIINPPYP